MAIQTIQFGDEGQIATRELLRRFDAVVASQPARHAALRRELASLEALERSQGGLARLDLEGLEDLVASIHRSLSEFEDPDLAIGVALWAIRHEVAILVPEAVVNALAERSNRAASPQELAAVFGLMQGVIAHLAPRLSADLERSDPERPWRVLHANFAITAIRTEDPLMMDFAFDALDRALPGESAHFYSEALALALGPRIAPAVRERIEARSLASCKQNLR